MPSQSRTTAFSAPLHSILPLLLLLLHPLSSHAQGVRAIYLFKDVLKSNTSSITSFFNTAIIYGIGLNGRGDVVYYSNTAGISDVLVASGGAYVGGEALRSKVRSLKAASSAIKRVEISMNSANLQELSANGFGNHTVHNNFAALRDAWALDAVNNNDESGSLQPSTATVTFARMLIDIGYKYTGMTYINFEFWKALVAKLGSPLVDRMYLQNYASGGGGNSGPMSLQNFTGVKVVPLVWVTNDNMPQQGQTPSQAGDTWAAWATTGALGGGGYWNDYDIENMGSSYEDYGRALDKIAPA